MFVVTASHTGELLSPSTCKCMTAYTIAFAMILAVGYGTTAQPTTIPSESSCPSDALAADPNKGIGERVRLTAIRPNGTTLSMIIGRSELSETSELLLSSSEFARYVCCSVDGQGEVHCCEEGNTPDEACGASDKCMNPEQELSN